MPGMWGDMIRTTSAPKAARLAHRAGAAMTLTNSITLIPASGRLSLDIDKRTGGV